jgi:hypothetical protein
VVSITPGRRVGKLSRLLHWLPAGAPETVMAPELEGGAARP